MEMRGRVLIYSILGCPFCMRAKNILLELDIPYTEVRLDKFPDEVRLEMTRRTGQSSVPQIFFNAHYIGGSEELYGLVHHNKLQLDKYIGELMVTPPPDDAPVPPDPWTALKTTDPGEIICDPNEDTEIIEKLKKSVIIKDYRIGFSIYKKVFTGTDFVEWTHASMSIAKSRAVELGQDLLDKHFFVRLKGPEDFLDEPVHYRLLEDCPFTALNAKSFYTCDPRDAPEVADDLRRMVLGLYDAFLSKHGKEVDYRSMEHSQEFKSYQRMTLELQRARVEACNPKQRLAFFINVYNALAIHGCIVRGAPKNMLQRYFFFNNVKYLIGGYEYSLQDIENGVLRSNRKGVGMFKKPFSPDDPRLGVALERHEPLIHFALVCGAKSCPPIKTYTPSDVINQLRLAAEAFLESPEAVKMSSGKKNVYISMIFKWYRADFGNTDGEVLQWIHSHMREGTKKTFLKELIDQENYTVRYLKYDWTSNAKH